jgi:hypothetical protein
MLTYKSRGRSMRHLIPPCWSVGCAIIALTLAACDRTTVDGAATLALRHDLRAACDSGLRYPYLLDLRIGRAYVVNGERMDSTRLAHWLNDRVRTYPAQRCRLVIYNDPSRRAELSWIVRTAGHAGVAVYEFTAGDSLCFPPIA